MKSCFSTAILPKKVFTLEFERSVEDSAGVKLYAKLNDAERVVVWCVQHLRH